MDRKYVSVASFSNLPRELDAHHGVAATNGTTVVGLGRQYRLDHYESRSGLTARPAMVSTYMEGWDILPAFREDTLTWAEGRDYIPPGLSEDDRFVVYSITGHGALGRLDRPVVVTGRLLGGAVKSWLDWRSGDLLWIPEQGDVGHYARRFSLARAKPGDRYLLSEVLTQASTVEQHGPEWTAWSEDGRGWYSVREDGCPPPIWTEVHERRTSTEPEEEPTPL